MRGFVSVKRENKTRKDHEAMNRMVSGVCGLFRLTRIANRRGVVVPNVIDSCHHGWVNFYNCTAVVAFSISSNILLVI